MSYLLIYIVAVGTLLSLSLGAWAMAPKLSYSTGRSYQQQKQIKLVMIAEQCKRGNLTFFQDHFFSNPNFAINEPLEDNKAGWQLIHIVSQCGHPWIIDQTLRHGADPNARSLERSTTPLLLAANNGYVKACEVLMAPRYSTGHFGLWTADKRELGLMYALGLRWDVSRREGADPRMRDLVHMSPIHAAVLSGNYMMVEYLLDNGADIEDRDRSGDTPLLLAVYNVHPVIVKVLISRGADLKASNFLAETALLVLRRAFEDEYEATYRPSSHSQSNANRISRQRFKQVIALLDRRLDLQRPENGAISVKFEKLPPGAYFPRANDLDEDELDDDMLRDYFENTVGPQYRRPYNDIEKHVHEQPQCYDSLKNARHAMVENQDRVFSSKFYFGPPVEESERVADLYAHVFGVLDGHASKEISEYLASNLPRRLEAAFHRGKFAYISSGIVSQANDDTSIDDEAQNVVSVRLDKKTSTLVKELIRKVIQELDEEICQLPGGYGTGSTVSFVLKIQNTAFVINIGDSRTIILEDETTMFTTNEHKPINEHERKHIERAGGFLGAYNRLNNVLDVSRAFGNCMFKASRQNALQMTDKCELYDAHNGMLRLTPDINVVHLNFAEHGYAFICATDGLLFQKAATDYIVNQFSLHADEPDICDTMTRHARQERSKDDISVIFVVYPFPYKSRYAAAEEVTSNSPKPSTKSTGRKVRYKRK